jgi:hypothetical protein
MNQHAFRIGPRIEQLANAAILVIIAAVATGCAGAIGGTQSPGADMAVGSPAPGNNGNDGGNSGTGGTGGGGGSGGGTDWKTAQLTTFTSYPACCPTSPVYDPNAPTDECADYSGCKYMGEFAAIGKQSFDYVKSHNLIAFYDDSDPNGKDFNNRYGGKTIHLKKDGNTFDAIVADTCGNNDCNGCCARNSKHGFLVDMEFWTAKNQLGSPDKASGTIQFSIQQ